MGDADRLGISASDTGDVGREEMDAVAVEVAAGAERSEQARESPHVATWTNGPDPARRQHGQALMAHKRCVAPREV